MYVNAMTFYYVGRRLRRARVPILPRVCEAATYFIFNCSIPLTAEIGPATRCEHRGVAVVIHPRARIGARCVIHAQVVIGGPGAGRTGAPTIEDDVVLSVGAKVIGPVTVGRGAVVGANAVVIRDVPSGTLAVGVPARVIER
jgi:serine O-acetyltransferase